MIVAFVGVHENENVPDDEGDGEPSDEAKEKGKPKQSKACSCCCFGAGVWFCAKQTEPLLYECCSKTVSLGRQTRGMGRYERQSTAAARQFGKVFDERRGDERFSVEHQTNNQQLTTSFTMRMMQRMAEVAQ